MSPYIIICILSCSCTFLATYKKRKHDLNIWAVLAILLPCILAGARDANIGTDISFYGQPIFQYALRCGSYLEGLRGTLVEPLFFTVVYIVSRFTDELFWALFSYQLLCIAFVYKALIDNDLGKYTWLGMFVYFMVFYNSTLNLMRQSISVAVLLYAFKYMKSRNIKAYLLLQLVSIGFHYTSIIGIVIFGIYLINSADDTRLRFLNKLLFKYRTLFNIVIIAGTVAVIILSQRLILLISQLTGRYAGQKLGFHSVLDFVMTDFILHSVLSFSSSYLLLTYC